MIKFTIFMSIALAALSASAQIRISKQGASLMVPNGAVPLDELENRDKVISKFKIEGDIIAENNSKNEYVIDRMQLSLFYNNKPVPTNYLSTVKTDAERRRNRLGLKDDYFTSSMVQLKGKDALIMRNKGEQWNYYNFFIINPQGTSCISGLLKFVSGQEAKAKQKIDALLESVQFQK